MSLIIPFYNFYGITIYDDIISIKRNNKEISYLNLIVKNILKVNIKEYER